MHLSEEESKGVEKINLPDQLANQIGQREHVSAQLNGQYTGQAPSFDPNARAWDEDIPRFEPSLDE